MSVTLPAAREHVFTPPSDPGEYKELTLGSTRRVHGLFEAAGAEFVPTRETLREPMNRVRRGLELQTNEGT